MSCAESSRLTAPPLKATRYLVKTILTGMMLICIMSVGACGKKPPHVDLPEGAEDSGFPHTYPDPKTNL